MRQHYSDIIQSADGPVRWFDEHGVPRFCEFEPSLIANIYATECALLLITCQGCGHPFKVVLSGTKRNAIFASIWDTDVEYGDPPNIQCCASGPTMNSVSRRVLEYWELVPGRKPVRHARVEIDIVPSWWDAAYDDEEASA